MAKSIKEKTMENENFMKQHDGESENLITQPEFTYLKLNGNTWKLCEICQCYQKRHQNNVNHVILVYVVNFDQISYIALVFRLLTLTILSF